MKIKFIFTIFIIMTLVGCNTSPKQAELSQQEMQQLNIIDPSLANNEQVIDLKEKGYLGEFIQVLNSEYENQKNEYVTWQSDQLKFWNLDMKETIPELELKAQEYLDKYHTGVKIGDDEFNKLVDYYMNNTDTPTAKKAREESEFGVLYSYMSLYKQFASDDSADYLMDKAIYNLTLLDICERDFNGNFTTHNTLNQFLYEKGLLEEPPKQPTTKN